MCWHKPILARGKTGIPREKPSSQVQIEWNSAHTQMQMAEAGEMIDDQHAHKWAIALQMSAWLSLYSGKLTLIGLFDNKSSCFPSPDTVPQFLYKLFPSISRSSSSWLPEEYRLEYYQMIQWNTILRQRKINFSQYILEQQITLLTNVWSQSFLILSRS